jgi:hypothetical protein
MVLGDRTGMLTGAFDRFEERGQRRPKPNAHVPQIDRMRLSAFQYDRQAPSSILGYMPGVAVVQEHSNAHPPRFSVEFVLPPLPKMGNPANGGRTNSTEKRGGCAFECSWTTATPGIYLSGSAGKYRE